MRYLLMSDGLPAGRPSLCFLTRASAPWRCANVAPGMLSRTPRAASELTAGTRSKSAAAEQTLRDLDSCSKRRRQALDRRHEVAPYGDSGLPGRRRGHRRHRMGTARRYRTPECPPTTQLCAIMQRRRWIDGNAAGRLRIQVGAVDADQARAAQAYAPRPRQSHPARLTGDTPATPGPGRGSRCGDDFTHTDIRVMCT